MYSRTAFATMRKGEPMINRETYCKDCDRSVYGKYHDCDVNIENDGKYVMGNEKCYCKIVNGERAEKYPWEGGNQSGSD